MPIYENTLAKSLDLDGLWQLEQAGITRNVKVPGVWEMQGGAGLIGIYRRQVMIPATWSEARVMLECDAVSYYVEVKINGQLMGTHSGLWTPFVVDLTEAVQFGQSNTLELVVTKPGGSEDTYPYRETLVGFIPYIAQTFGGPWQGLRLVAHTVPAWTNVHISPDWTTGIVALSAQVAGQLGRLQPVASIADVNGQVVAQATLERIVESNALGTQITVPNYHSWSPTDPYHYTIHLHLRDGDKIASQATRQIGFRQLIASDELLLLNGKPTHLRGLLSWGWNPATLAPCFSDDEIRDEFRRAREHGFNLIKLCLFVPPSRYYEIADEEGMLLWLELPLWLPHLNDQLRHQARQEYADILARDHHHPSLVLYSLGCELGADMADAALLQDLDAIVRRATTGVLVCDNSGSGEAYRGLTFDYADFTDYHFYCDLHQFNPLVDHFHRDWRPARPWIFGEFCDKDDFRDPVELVDADGMRPWWRELYGVWGDPSRWRYPTQEVELAALNLPFGDQQFRDIARSESLLVRKVILEQTRLRRFIGGYVVTGLRDTPITTSGIFDDRNQPKYDADVFCQFNADSLLLLEQGRSRMWQHGGDRPSPSDLFNHVVGEPVDLRVVLAYTELAHSSHDLKWSLHPSGSQEAVLDGTQPVKVPADSPGEIARLNFTLPPSTTAAAWELRISLGEICNNTWNIWSYPDVPNPLEQVAVCDATGIYGTRLAFDSTLDQVLLTTEFSVPVQRWVQQGGRAIVLLAAGSDLPVVHLPFWRESIKLLYDHPIMKAIPHNGYADLQFYNLATDYALDTAPFEELLLLDSEQLQITPIMRRLDARLFTAADYLVEARLGDGVALISTLRFQGSVGDQTKGLDANPVARYWLTRMIQYLQP